MNMQDLNHPHRPSPQSRVRLNECNGDGMRRGVGPSACRSVGATALLFVLLLSGCKQLEQGARSLERQLNGESAPPATAAHQSPVPSDPGTESSLPSGSKTSPTAAAGEQAVVSMSAGADPRWRFDQVVAGEFGVGDARPRVLVDPACPTAFAAVGLRGSRWAVTFQGTTWSGFDAVHSNARPHDGKATNGFAISRDGEHIGFLASRDSKCFYVVDGVEGPAAESGLHGPLMFSDDGASHAYQIGDGQLVVDGRLVDGDPTDALDVVSGLGFVPGTRSLHYSRLLKPQAAGPGGVYLVVSGDRRFEGLSQARVREPGFFEDGTPFWYELVDGDQQALYHEAPRQLVVDGELMLGVGVLWEPSNSNSNGIGGIPDMIARIFGGEDGRSHVGFYVRHDGRSRSFDIPAAVLADSRSIRVDNIRISPDMQRLAYQLGDRIVVGEVAYPTYQSIGEFGFTASGRCVATVWQGGRMFVLVDGVELPESWKLNLRVKLHISAGSDRVVVHGLAGRKQVVLVGELSGDSLVLTDEAPIDWPMLSEFTTSEDGRVLLALGTRYDKGTKSRVVLRDLQSLSVDGVSPGTKYTASPNGSVVLWEGNVDAARSGRTAVLANERLLGRVRGFRDVVFGAGGHYVFSARRHPVPGQKPRDAAKLPPLLCVDGTFFAGLRPLATGTWVGGAFHVLCARGEGDNAEVFMASYRP
jgi:hypothetical protein